jgi:hypothetical protein
MRTITEDGRPVQITMHRLSVRRNYIEACAGKVTAMRIVASKASQMERERRELWRQRTEEAGELYRQQMIELYRQRKAGVIEPKVIPHPDDIELNLQTLEVEIFGPINEAQYEKVLYLSEYLNGFINKFDEEELIKPHSKAEKAQHREQVEEFNELLPKRLQRRPFP